LSLGYADMQVAYAIVDDEGRELFRREWSFSLTVDERALLDVILRYDAPARNLQAQRGLDMGLVLIGLTKQLLAFAEYLFDLVEQVQKKIAALL